jgi:F-type H+-transporting ATPase subunit delta
MRSETIARNYAEALLVLAQQARDPAGWGRMIADVGKTVEDDVAVRQFLESPRVSASERMSILGKAFQDRFPRPFVAFLQAVVHHRRQMLIPEIGRAYRTLLDEVEGRVRADVTVARSEQEADRVHLARQLERIFGGRREVVPVMHVNPTVLGGGGIIARVGDRVLDASVRSRLARLRQQLILANGSG